MRYIFKDTYYKKYLNTRLNKLFEYNYWYFEKKVCYRKWKINKWKG